MKLILASGSQGRKSLLESLGLKFEVIESNVDEEKLQSKDPVEMAVMRARAKGEAVVEILSVIPAKAGIQDFFQRKIDSGFRQNDKLLILAADTVGFMGNWIFNKPTSREEAEETLARLSGKTHKYVSAHTVLKFQIPNPNSHVIPAKAGIQELDSGWSLPRMKLRGQNDKNIRKKVTMKQWSNGAIAKITGYDLSSVTFRKLTRDDIRVYLDHVDYLKLSGGYKISNSPQNFTIATEGSISNIIGLSLEKIIPVLRENFLL